MVVRFLEWNETVLTEIRPPEESRDLGDDVKVLSVVHIVVVQEDLFAFPVAVGAVVRKLVPHDRSNDVQVDVQDLFQTRDAGVRQGFLGDDAQGLTDSIRQDVLCSVRVVTEIVVIS